MKFSVVGLGVALALAGLTIPGTAADSRSSGGFSSGSRTESSSRPAPRTESRAPESKAFTAPTPPTRQSGGFSSDRPVQFGEQPRQSGGFTATPRDGAASATTSPAPRTANGFSSPSSSSSSNNMTGAQPRVAQPVAPSAVDRLAARSNSQDAFRQFKKEQTVYKNPEVAPVNQQAAQSSSAWKNYGSGWKSPDDYYRSRSGAFARNPGFEHYYTAPPVWVQSRPNYGAYAAAFLGGAVLDHILEPSYASWAYSHQSDPDLQSWHREMMDQSRDNDELRQKMAVYDRQIAELQAKNAPKTDALPADVDPSLVVAPSTAIVATTPEPSSGHPILWTIFGSVLGIGGFIGACLFISQRKRKSFA